MRVGAQLPVQNTLAHINSIDFLGAMLEQAVCEPARGGADVCTDTTGHIHRESQQRRFQLVAAA